MSDHVILVDENDREIGVADKLQAHRLRQLHRAFSIFIFNEGGKLLLQKRARQKYHSGGLWTNTCCSHPAPGAELLQQARHKLQQEMGFACDLKHVLSFRYTAEVDNGLYENELDHIFVGTYNGEPAINPAEVEAWQWVDWSELKQDIQLHPERYTYWLSLAIERLEEWRIGS
jgi:isopentenyl-diphosphate delta-isomerase